MADKKCLKITSLVLAILKLIGCIILAIIIVVGLIGVSNVKPHDHDQEEAITILKVILGISLVIYLISIVINSVLIHGIRKEIVNALLCWIIFDGIINGIALIMGLVKLAGQQIAFGLIGWAIWIVIFLFYRECKKGSRAAYGSSA